MVIYQRPGNDLLKEICEAAFRTMGYNRNFTDYVDATGELKRSIIVDYFAESEEYTPKLLGTHKKNAILVLPGYGAHPSQYGGDLPKLQPNNSLLHWVM